MRRIAPRCDARMYPIGQGGDGGDSPYYTIAVSPDSIPLVLDGGGNQVGQIVFTATINRFNGYVGIVNVTLPVLYDFWDGFSIEINGSPLQDQVQGEAISIPNAPDSFDISWQGTGQGWTEMRVVPDAPFALTGNDGVGDPVSSNVFEIS